MAKVLELVDARLGGRVLADDRAALESDEDLGCVKAQHRHVAVPQDAAALVLHAEGMRRVIDHAQVVGVGDRLDGLGVAGMAVAMHRHDRRRLRRDERLDARRIEIQGARVDVCEDGLDAVPQQRVRSGHERIRRGDDLARDAHRLECRDQRDRAVGEERDVLHAQVLAQRLLQLLVERPTVGEDLVVPDLLQVGQELVQRWQVGLGHVHRLGHGRFFF
ncbi:hypothetical protein FQZ97_767590 [compost metagenome]